MFRRRALTLVCFCAAAAAGPRHTGFSGAWKLNLIKSDLGSMPPPAAMTLRVEQKEPDLKVKTKITGGPQGDLDFGYRRDELTREKGPHATACQPAAGSALLRGETMISWRVWDVMRSIDWIGTRPELAADRVGCLGISSGGTCTLFSAALDLRIKAAFVSGYLNPFRDSIMSISHCIDNYVPGILNWAENYDIAGLIAPRPLFSERGDQDPIFPVAATRESYARAKRVYEVFGAGAHIQQEVFAGEHSFHGVRGLPFLAAALA